MPSILLQPLLPILLMQTFTSAPCRSHPSEEAIVAQLSTRNYIAGARIRLKTRSEPQLPPCAERTLGQCEYSREG